MRLPRGTFGISAVVGVLIAAGCAGGAVAGSSGTGGSSQLRAPRPVRTLRPVRRPHRRRTSGARRPVPILMYHDIGPVPAGEPYPELFTAPAVFRTELRALA